MLVNGVVELEKMEKAMVAADRRIQGVNLLAVELETAVQRLGGLGGLGEGGRGRSRCTLRHKSSQEAGFDPSPA